MIYWVVHLKTFSSLMITTTTATWHCRSSTRPSVSPCFGLSWVFEACEYLWGHCCLPTHGQQRWSLFLSLMPWKYLGRLISKGVCAPQGKHEAGGWYRCVKFIVSFCVLLCFLLMARERRWPGQVCRVCGLRKETGWKPVRRSCGNMS